MYWFRIDNRLVHGQIIEAWVPHIRAAALVVANDELAADELRQEIMSLAVPSNVTFCCCRVTDARYEIERLDQEKQGRNILVLFANCADAKAAYGTGIGITQVNLGNLHYGPGKDVLCEHIAVSPDDRSCLSYLRSMGVELDFRCVPNKPAKVLL